MANDTKKNESTSAPRRPYETPKVVESADFEHLVLTCGHTSSGVPSCNPKSGGTLHS